MRRWRARARRAAHHLGVPSTGKLRFAARALPWAGLAALLVWGMSLWVDRPVAYYFKAREADAGLFKLLEDVGNGAWFLWPSGVLALVLWAAWRLMGPGTGPTRRRTRHLAEAVTFFFSAVALSGLVVVLLKVVFGRTRARLLFESGDYHWLLFAFGSENASFPSGHANTAFAAALALGFLLPRGRWLFVALALPVAFARVAMTQHYLSDILGGAAVAYLTTYWLRTRFAAWGMVFFRFDGRWCLKPLRQSGPPGIAPPAEGVQTRPQFE
ncbi:phosphatase PAP2 family protein [Zavarzinia sp. CC-PAN008]|uniref:phosphatase PAP2 family protein n=1 Tax=Zavarzinia sp. CC-PAN008 TaxID=3243332 RepID=UPI003F743D6E